MAQCRPTTSRSVRIGGVILWFGWYGFNPGSTLSAMDWEGIGRVAANTTLAACAAGLVAVLFVYPRSKTWDLGISVNGFLGGLVAITCPVLLGVAVRRDHDRCRRRHRRAARRRLHGASMRWDDPIGAVAVHFFAGIWGTLSLGLFGAGKYGIPTPTGADTTQRRHRPVLRQPLVRTSSRRSSSGARRA